MSQFFWPCSQTFFSLLDFGNTEAEKFACLQMICFCLLLAPTPPVTVILAIIICQPIVNITITIIIIVIINMIMAVVIITIIKITIVVVINGKLTCVG